MFNLVSCLLHIYSVVSCLVCEHIYSHGSPVRDEMNLRELCKRFFIVVITQLSFRKANTGAILALVFIKYLTRYHDLMLCKGRLQKLAIVEKTQ